MKFSKQQLNRLATIVGVICGTLGILGENGYVEARLGRTAAAVGIFLGGVISQQPATAHPTTEEVEDRETET